MSETREQMAVRLETAAAALEHRAQSENDIARDCPSLRLSYEGIAAQTLAQAAAERAGAAAMRAQEAFREVLFKVRGHTRYLPGAPYTLLAGLLQSIERIVDAALITAETPPEAPSELRNALKNLSCFDPTRWLVVRDKGADGIECYRFTDEAEAQAFHDLAQAQWSLCWLARVVRLGMQPEVAALQAETPPDTGQCTRCGHAMTVHVGPDARCLSCADGCQPPEASAGEQGVRVVAAMPVAQTGIFHQGTTPEPCSPAEQTAYVVEHMRSYFGKPKMASPEPGHRCGGCGYRWTDVASSPIELCGDCWRVAWPAVRGRAGVQPETGHTAEDEQRSAVHDFLTAYAEFTPSEKVAFGGRLALAVTLLQQAEAEVQRLTDEHSADIINLVREKTRAVTEARAQAWAKAVAVVEQLPSKSHNGTEWVKRARAVAALRARQEKEVK